MKSVKFNIQGMTCSSCVSHVEKAVNKLEGIKKVNVNLLSNSMNVEYNEKLLDNKKIIDAVVNAGYGASTDEQKAQDKKDTTKDNIKSMKKRLIISICLLIPLMYISMNHMLYEWFGLPVPGIIKTLFHGTENAVIFAFTQFLLLIPIIYVNRNYFIVGFKRLIKRSPNMDSLIAIRKSSINIIWNFCNIYDWLWIRA